MSGGGGTVLTVVRWKTQPKSGWHCSLGLGPGCVNREGKPSTSAHAPSTSGHAPGLSALGCEWDMILRVLQGPAALTPPL